MNDSSRPTDSAIRKEQKENAKNEQGLSAPTVYEIISLEGIEEMRRPTKSLWWSGVVAGIAISLSLYMMAALRLGLEGSSAGILEKFGYSVGFLIVVLSRLQLFTENTVTPILPALNNPSRSMLLKVLRLWAIVILANLCGTFCAAIIPLTLPMFTDAHVAAMLDISRHYAHRPMVEVFFSAIPAGFMVAIMVWMLKSSKGFEFWTITAITFSIAVLDTSHVIVGSTELFMVLFNGDINLMAALSRLLLTATGNIIGGTVLFAGLAYAQVSEEL